MVFHEVCVPRPGVEKALLVRPNDAQRRTLGKTMTWRYTLLYDYAAVRCVLGWGF